MTTTFNNSKIKINLDELIFINKEYGAYILRRTYNKNLSFSMLITVILFTGIISHTLLNKNEINSPIKIPGFEIPINFTVIEIEKIKIESLGTETIKKFKPTAKFVAPKVVEDYRDIEEAAFPTQEELINKNIGTSNIEGDPEGIDISPEEILTENSGTETQKPPYTWVEKMPHFSSGNQELLKFMAKNIKYPEIAKRAGIEGKVILQFIVEQDGSISDINVIKGIGGGCDEEAVKVLKLTGKWNPGKQNGKPVRVRMNIPFVFNLQ